MVIGVFLRLPLRRSWCCRLWACPWWVRRSWPHTACASTWAWSGDRCTRRSRSYCWASASTTCSSSYRRWTIWAARTRSARSRSASPWRCVTPASPSPSRQSPTSSPSPSGPQPSVPSSSFTFFAHSLFAMF